MYNSILLAKRNRQIVFYWTLRLASWLLRTVCDFSWVAVGFNQLINCTYTQHIERVMVLQNSDDLCCISKCLCRLYFVLWIVEIAKPDYPQQSVEDVEASRIPNHPQPGQHVSVYLMAHCGLHSLSLKL